MKKLFAILLCAALALSLCACEYLEDLDGSATGTPGENTPAQSPEETQTALPSPTVTPDGSTPDAAPVDFAESGTLDMDLNGDGKLEHVSFELTESEDGYGEYITMKIASDGGGEAYATLQLPYAPPEVALAYDIDKDGLVELFISGDVMSSDYATWVFRYDGNDTYNDIYAAEASYPYDEQPEYTLPTISGMVEKIEGDVITVGDTVDILGSWWCATQYKMSETAFALERVSDSVWVNRVVDFSADGFWEYGCMVTSAEFPVTLDGQTGETTLPVGTKLVPVDTDGKTYVHFVTEDGTLGTVYVDFAADDWFYTINGVNEYDLFSQLPYAG